MLDSLVRVSRRDDEKHFVSVLPMHGRPKSFPTHSERSKTGNITESNARPTASHRFLFSNCRYFFTLFSKFFSSFPHGTCLLSVSYPYLALDGIYHPIRAAIPNNSTHGRVKTAFTLGYGAVTLLGTPFQTILLVIPRCPLLLQTTTPKIFSLSFSHFTRRYYGNPG